LRIFVVLHAYARYLPAEITIIANTTAIGTGTTTAATARITTAPSNARGAIDSNIAAAASVFSWRAVVLRLSHERKYQWATFAHQFQHELRMPETLFTKMIQLARMKIARAKNNTKEVAQKKKNS